MGGKVVRVIAGIIVVLVIVAGVALGVYYGTEEAKEVGAAFREKRTPDVAKYR